MVLEEFNKELQLRDVDIPKVSEGEILVKVKNCSICGTDLKIMSGKIDTVPLPLIMGHEPSGEIVEIGSGVKGFEIGDRIIVDIYITCEKCKNCLAGRRTACLESIKRIGFEANGGFAEYMLLPAERAVKFPNTISFDLAAVIPDAISTSVHAFNDRQKITPGDTILILGLGGLGIHGMQVAKAYGGIVIAADIDHKKLSLAKELGADYTFDPSETDLLKSCKELTNGYGVDISVDYVGISAVSELTLKCVRMGGTMIMLGYAPGTVFEVPSMDVAMGERTITGSRAMSKGNIREGIRLVSEGKVKPQIDSYFPLEDANIALEHLKSKGYLGRGLLVIDK